MPRPYLPAKFAIPTILTALLVLTAPATAADWYVSPTGDNTATGTRDDPFATIQHAIDVSEDHDTIYLHSGTYTGDGNRDIGLVEKTLTIRSISGNPATCVIDCQGTEEEPHIAFLGVAEWSETSMIGFSIRGAWTSPTLRAAIDLGQYVHNAGLWDVVITGTHGTAIYAEHYSSFILRRCRIVDNTEHGIVTHTGMPPMIMDSKILRNGGHGVMEVDYAFCPRIYLARCRIEGNAGSGVWSDGGWSEWEESWDYAIRIFHCDILNNGDIGVHVDAPMQLHGSTVAGNHGGGLIAMGDRPQEWDIQNSRILDNDGDGIRARVEFPAYWPLGLQTSEIRGNRGNGVVLTLDAYYFEYRGSTYLFNDCLVADNKGHGAVLAVADDGQPFGMEGCTVVGNRGAGLFLPEMHADREFTIDTSIIAFNDGAALMEGEPGSGKMPVRTKAMVLGAVTCTDIYGNASDWTGQLAAFAGVDGNLAVGPGFCGDGAYGLEAGSPCAEENSPECGTIGARGVECAGVTDVAGDVVPGAGTRLIGAFPNPFNPVTTLVYELAGPSVVDLRVYDLKGRLVRSLETRKARSAGEHRVVWDGRDDGGREVATGVYLWQMATGDIRATARMTLVK